MWSLLMDEPVRALPGAASGGTPSRPTLLDFEAPLHTGGHGLRTALALSCATGQPFRMRQVRAAAERPGLQRPHLACVLAAQSITQARVSGVEPGATEFGFEPGPVQAGDYTFGVGGGGSCTQLFQTIWPALMMAGGPSQVALRGGTHTPDAPPFQFLSRACAPLMRRLGAGIELRLRRHGFQATGGGGFEAQVLAPVDGALQPFDILERGPAGAAYAECLAAAVPRHVAVRELDMLGRLLDWRGEQLRQPLMRQNEGPGNALLATLEHADVVEVISACGEKGVSAETVARRVAREVREHLASPAALGPHLATQWLVPLALAVQRSGRAARFTCTALTPQAQTSLELIPRFLRVSVAAERLPGGWLVRVAPQAG
jgi:RNA 3'-terminal phosphate cyclase (ATP)